MKKKICLLLCMVLLWASVGAYNQAAAAVENLKIVTPSAVKTPLLTEKPEIESIKPREIPMQTKQEVTLLYPRNGEVFKQGQPFVIQFMVKNPGTYIILGSRDSGKTWAPIPNGTITTNQYGYFPYKFAEPGTFRIKVQKAADSSIYDTGNDCIIGSELWDGQLQARAGDSKIELTWKPVVNLAGVVTYYNIYRSTPNPGSPELLCTTILLTADSPGDNPIFFSDNYVNTHQLYYYWVFPLIEGQEYNHIYDIYNMVSAISQGTIILTIGDPYMIVNGETMEIDPGKGTVPVIVNGRIFLPIKAVVGAMGGTVNINTITPTPKVVTIYYNKNTVELQIGSMTAVVNGKKMKLDAAPVFSDTGSILVPVRVVSEFLGCTVNFDSATQRVTIIY